MMNMEVNGTTIQVKLYENSSAEAVKELLKKGPFTIEMKDYAHMEKFGSFGMQFPTNDETITTEAGDVISIMHRIRGILRGLERSGICQRQN